MITRKLVATIAAAGALTLGTAGAAVAASTTGSAPSGSASTTTSPAPSGTGTGGLGTGGTSDAVPGATTTPACGPKQAGRLYLMEHRQAAVQDRITKLQAAETKASGHPRLLARITDRVRLLQGRENAISARVQKLEGRCPGLTPAPPAAGGSGASSMTTGGSGSTPSTPSASTTGGSTGPSTV